MCLLYLAAAFLCLKCFNFDLWRFHWFKWHINEKIVMISTLPLWGFASFTKSSDLDKVIPRSQVLFHPQVLAGSLHASFSGSSCRWTRLWRDTENTHLRQCWVGFEDHYSKSFYFCFPSVTRNTWKIQTARLMPKANYLILWNTMKCHN